MFRINIICGRESGRVKTYNGRQLEIILVPVAKR